MRFGSAAALGLIALPVMACAEMTSEQRITASGNEPFWRAEVSDGNLLLTRLGMDDLTLPVQSTERRDGGETLIHAHDDEELVGAYLILGDEICLDSMSGMPFPQTASIEMGDNVMNGCAGDPESLLTGGEWLVEDLQGRGVLDRVQTTLVFDGEGNIAGSGGCNRYFGTYELTGETLTFGTFGSTRMACPDAIMDQEDRFFAAVETVIGFDIDETGALILRGPEGPLMLARKLSTE